MDRQELFESSLEQLEYERILEHVAGYAASSLGVEHIIGTRPLSDRDAIRRELRMVGEARALLARQERIPLDGIFDIRRALAISRTSNAALDGSDLQAVATTLRAFRLLRDFFSPRDEAPLLRELTAEIHASPLLEKHIGDAIDDNGRVRDTATRELFSIRRDIIDKSAALRERLQRILRRTADEELLTEEFVTLREGRLVIPVRVEHKRKIPGIIHGESKTGATVFLEPAEIFDMNNEIAELTFAERREVEKILRTLTGELGAEAEPLRDSVWRVQLLDSVVARARYGENYDCVEPIVSDEHRIILEDARHPILQLRLPTVVPMSIEMDAGSRCVIISGPNAGGKTVAIKTLGLATMMALGGIHPPAKTCVVHPCAIFSDIGDRQSVENDLSTFSAHMTRVKAIMDSVEPGDVILLDELGTGTDPDEGAAIAAAVLERLLARKAFVMATTHHSALKVFAYETDGVENAGMEFNMESLSPTYRLTVGIPGNSYAFELLDRFGFDGQVVVAAKERLGEERNAMTDIIGRLERSLAETRQLEEQQRSELSRAESLRERYEVEAAVLREKKNEIMEKARKEATAALNEANSLIENTLREIRSGADNDQVKKMRRSIDEAKKNLSATLQENQANVGDGIRKGDTVRLKDGTQTGEVETDPDADGNVVVQFGAVRMRSHLSELDRVSGKERRRQERASRGGFVNPEEVRSRIDLRGMYSDEAGVEIEQAIAAALSGGVAYIEIIHGKGTGALRKKTHEVLRDHPHVETFRVGAVTEGGEGVTIVELK